MEGGYGGPGLDEVPELEGADEFDPFEVVECIEEIVKNVPEAPSETQWYHGRLDRAIAEERLRQSGKPGSYLIRESDRRPGSFVLSFYGRTGMDHFKVTSVCGAFYIGGREFESLSLLIGYYTGWSDLLKGERLQHPVPPPDFVQPVFRRKRVRAVSSYTKSPETDELSFVKGEMFVVHNDLGDDWVWVTSLLTDDSGIINQKLVQSIPDDVDPVEQFPWFHPNISKEEAAEKLAASGPGSWLVKKSDSTEGDFSIYFYCKDQIQRFKIKRTSASYFMGGRTFKSVSEVVKRYQNEQIVEGYSLQKPVYRVAELSPEPSDLTSKEQAQTSIKQSTGSNFFLNKKDVIVIKGRLNKKTQKTKKWKRMYFVLNGTEQQLYYFDSEKRSKPKGLIDLSFASIYPVHDSLFGRPNVFQVFSRGLNQASLCYLCADSVDDAQEWVRSLKSYCCNTRSVHNLPQNIPNLVLTELRSLRVKIFELSQPLPKHFSQPYCVVSLNEFKVCRTRVVQGENCCWDEEFAIEDIPADINSFNISIYNKELIKDREISSLKFSISEVNSDRMIEDRFNLPPNSSTSKTDRGTLRIGYQYLHEKIMSLHEYAKLKDLLLKNNMEYVLALTSTCDDYHERASLSTSLLHLFRHEKQEKLLLIKFLEIDLEMEEGKERLFRGETFGTTMMDQYMKMVSTTFLQHALQDTINKILKQMSETNSSEDLNPKCIISHLTDVVHNISSSVKYVPTVLRHVCHFLQRKVSEKWPDDSLIRTRVISAFIFLRLICPAMINPRQFNLITETPSQMAVKTLKHVAKCLIKLANLTDCKEAGMESVNHFINENKKMIVSFADGVSNVPNASNMSPPCTMDVSRCLASIHRFCNAHLEKLKKMSQSQPSVANLVAVTESLTSRKRQNVKKE